jgi:hypothetical protein
MGYARGKVVRGILQKGTAAQITVQHRHGMFVQSKAVNETSIVTHGKYY